MVPRSERSAPSHPAPAATPCSSSHGAAELRTFNFGDPGSDRGLGHDETLPRGQTGAPMTDTEVALVLPEPGELALLEQDGQAA